jgi:hypothetical protein
LYELGESVCLNKRFVRSLIYRKEYLQDYELLRWDGFDCFSRSKKGLEIEKPEGNGWCHRLSSWIRELTLGPASNSWLISMDFRPTSTPSFNIFGYSGSVRT